MDAGSLFRRGLLAGVFALLSLVAFSAAPRSLGWSVEGVRIIGGGDSLRVRVLWAFNDWEMDGNKAMVFAPSIVNGEHRATLRPVTVYGKRLVGDAYRVVASGNIAELAVVDLSKPVMVLTEDVLPRREWMDTVRVVLSVSEWARRSGLVLRSTSQRGVFTRPAEPARPVFPWTPLVPEEDRSERREQEFEAPVAFDPESSKYDAYLGDNGYALDGFYDRLQFLTSGKEISVLSSELAVTVPPMGDENAELKLSGARVQSLYSYFRKRGAFRVRVPVRKAGGADWEGVSDWVSNSRFSGDQRLREILSLDLGSGYIWEALSREKPAAMEEMGRDCFPGLSRVYYRFTYKVPRFEGPAAIEKVASVVPEILSARDFWRLVSLEESGSDAWLDALVASSKYHPEDRAFNYDIAMALMDRGAFNRAVPFVRGVGTLSDEGLYAFGVWLFGMGRYDEALSVFESLKGRSSAYVTLFDAVKLYADWKLSRVEWERFYP